MIGQTFGRLTVVAPGPRGHKPRWLCRCTCGAEKYVRGDNLRDGTTRSCGCLHREVTAAHSRLRRGPANPRWRGDDIGRGGVHDRLRRKRGKAADHACVDCGEQARDWSYDEPEGYSTDLSRYVPRCRSCHVKWDGRFPHMTPGAMA